MVDRDTSTVPTVYIADRGYESYNNLAHIQEKGRYFLVRIKDVNSTGIVSRFSPEELKKLYSMRWGIETSFRSLKYTLALNYFHSKKAENIRQEIFAKLTMYNFTELIISQIMIKKAKRKYTYKANFSAAVHICAKFFSENLSPPVVEALISKHLAPIKPSSSNPRKLS